MAYRASTKATTKTDGVNSGDNVTIAAPTALNGDIIILALENYAQTVTWPAGQGFTAFTGSATVGGSFGRSSSWRAAWKLSSGSEPATYVLHVGGGSSIPLKAVCASFSGRTGTPGAVITNDAGGATSPVTGTMTGYTAVAGDDVCIIIGCAANETTGTTWALTAPTNYTTRQEQNADSSDTGLFYCGETSIVTRDALAAGATGNLTCTETSSGKKCSIGSILISMASSATGGVSRWRKTSLGGGMGQELVGGIRG
jgi:hypothetical protein